MSVPTVARKKKQGTVGTGSATTKKHTYRPGGSCAECKRLKIKCTKGAGQDSESFPCDSCIRRGCQAICPEGSLTPGKSGRFVLANTEDLHRKILELSSRIRDLEEAVQELQASISTESHPLLRKDLLLIKAPLESETVLRKDLDDESPELLESLDTLAGSLSLRTSGRSNFHARTAGSWYFLQNEDPDPTAPQEGHGPNEQALPTDILYASHMFPLGTIENTRNDLRNRMQEFFPDRETGLRLVDNYFNGIAWMYDPIPRPQFNTVVFDAIYAPHCINDSIIIAVYFIVLAIGTLMDLHIPNYSPQATRYYELSRAALGLDITLDEPSIPTIQALHLLGLFLHMSDSKGGFGTSWALMGLNAKMAVGGFVSLGLSLQTTAIHPMLDRDGSKWDLGGEAEIRQKLFWELYTYDTWQSMPSGRPPSLHRLSVDCKMPYKDLMIEHSNSSDPCDIFKAWKHRFCHERISPMVEQSCGPRTPSYDTILLLDRRIREDPVPPVLQLTPANTHPSLSLHNSNTVATHTLQRYTVLCVREISLLLMHRPFFAHATSEKAPLDTKFAPSILAVYRSACSIIAGVCDLYDQQPVLSPRVWFFWAHVFSATICLGGLVVRCPSLSLAPSALAQVESACDLFSRVMDSNRVSKALPSMVKLRDKARQALADYRVGQQTQPMEEHPQDELSALVGETRLIVHRTLQSFSPEQSTCVSTLGHTPGIYEPVQTSGTFTEIQHAYSQAAQGDNLQNDYPLHTHGTHVLHQQPQPFYNAYQYTDAAQYSEQSIPPSILHSLSPQEQIYYPFEYLPQHPEQQVFHDQGERDHTWRNFMVQLGVDFS